MPPSTATSIVIAGDDALLAPARWLAVGWTGAVLLPYLYWRRLARGIASGEPGTLRRLVRFPAVVAALALGTSSLGYFLGAIQIQHFAALPPLETIKIIIQGPVLGAAFAVAAYLLAERAVQRSNL